MKNLFLDTETFNYYVILKMNAADQCFVCCSVISHWMLSWDVLILLKLFVSTV